MLVDPAWEGGKDTTCTAATVPTHSLPLPALPPFITSHPCSPPSVTTHPCPPLFQHCLAHAYLLQHVSRPALVPAGLSRPSCRCYHCLCYCNLLGGIFAPACTIEAHALPAKKEYKMVPYVCHCKIYHTSAEHSQVKGNILTTNGELALMYVSWLQVLHPSQGTKRCILPQRSGNMQSMKGMDSVQHKK